MCVCVEGLRGPFHENEISRNDEIRAGFIAAGVSSVTFLMCVVVCVDIIDRSAV